jgi:hypothetical protein
VIPPTPAPTKDPNGAFELLGDGKRAVGCIKKTSYNIYPLLVTLALILGSILTRLCTPRRRAGHGNKTSEWKREATLSLLIKHSLTHLHTKTPSPAPPLALPLTPCVCLCVYVCVCSQHDGASCVVDHRLLWSASEGPSLPQEALLRGTTHPLRPQGTPLPHPHTQ